MQMRALLKIGLLVASCLGAVAANAGDKDAKYYQAQFDRFSRAIAELKAADANEELGQEIEVIRTWISQAQAFLAADKLDEIEPLVERIAAQAEYVRAKLKRMDADEAADVAEAEAKKVEAKAEKTAQAADAAEKKYKDLESKGL